MFLPCGMVRASDRRRDSSALPTIPRGKLNPPVEVLPTSSLSRAPWLLLFDPHPAPASRPAEGAPVSVPLCLSAAPSLHPSWNVTAVPTPKTDGHAVGTIPPAPDNTPPSARRRFQFDSGKTTFVINLLLNMPGVACVFIMDDLNRMWPRLKVPPRCEACHWEASSVSTVCQGPAWAGGCFSPEG